MFVKFIQNLFCGTVVYLPIWAFTTNCFPSILERSYCNHIQCLWSGKIKDIVNSAIFSHHHHLDFNFHVIQIPPLYLFSIFVCSLLWTFLSSFLITKSEVNLWIHGAGGEQSRLTEQYWSACSLKVLHEMMFISLFFVNYVWFRSGFFLFFFRN